MGSKRNNAPNVQFLIWFTLSLFLILPIKFFAWKNLFCFYFQERVGEIEYIFVSNEAREELSKRQPSLTNVALHLPAVLNFGRKICYQLLRSIYFTTNFIGFQESFSINRSHEPVKLIRSAHKRDSSSGCNILIFIYVRERILQQAVGFFFFFTLANGVYFS